MTSHASVNVMLALETAFDVEFPDAMLKRSVFESVRSISAGARDARGRGMTASPIERDQAFLDDDPADRRRRRRAERRRRRPRRALPGRDDRRAPRGAARCRRFVPTELGGGGVSLRGARAARASSSAGAAARAAMVFAHAPDPGRDASSATSTARRGSRRYLRERRRASSGCIASVTSEVGTGGDIGRSIAAVTPGRATAVPRSRSRRRPCRYGAHADDLLTTAAPQPGRRARRPGPRR